MAINPGNPRLKNNLVRLFMLLARIENAKQREELAIQLNEEIAIRELLKDRDDCVE